MSLVTRIRRWRWRRSTGLQFVGPPRDVDGTLVAAWDLWNTLAMSKVDELPKGAREPYLRLYATWFDPEARDDARERLGWFGA